MVGRSRKRRKRGSPELLGNHQNSWIWGRHTVLETLRAGHWGIAELVGSEDLASEDAHQLQTLAESNRVPLTWKPPSALRQLCHAPDHQGYLARMLAFPYASSSELLLSAPAVPLFLVLDRIQDPFNFGAMIRTAEGLGVDGILIGERFQTPVNSQVARSSAGAVNYLPVARVPQLPAAVETLHKKGIQIIAASEKAEQAIWDVDFSGPCAVVVGNEGEGLHPEILKHCVQKVAIPQSGQVSSLNAAVSAGILLYEIYRQRNQESESS